MAFAAQTPPGSDRTARPGLSTAVAMALCDAAPLDSWPHPALPALCPLPVPRSHRAAQGVWVTASTRLAGREVCPLLLPYLGLHVQQPQRLVIDLQQHLLCPDLLLGAQMHQLPDGVVHRRDGLTLVHDERGQVLGGQAVVSQSRALLVPRPRAKGLCPECLRGSQTTLRVRGGHSQASSGGPSGQSPTLVDVCGAMGSDAALPKQTPGHPRPSPGSGHQPPCSCSCPGTGLPQDLGTCHLCLSPVSSSLLLLWTLPRCRPARLPGESTCHYIPELPLCSSSSDLMLLATCFFGFWLPSPRCRGHCWAAAVPPVNVKRMSEQPTGTPGRPAGPVPCSPLSLSKPGSGPFRPGCPTCLHQPLPNSVRGEGQPGEHQHKPQAVKT